MRVYYFCNLPVFYMTKFLSREFLSWCRNGNGQQVVSGFFLYILVSIFFLKNTQRAPDTRWGSIDGHRGVLENFCVFVFLTAYFFVCVCADVQCTGCHCFVCQPATGPLRLTWEGRAADQCTAAHCAKAPTCNDIDYNAFVD